MAMSENPSNKRKSESTHRSVRVERLSKHGIFMKTSALIQKSSKDLGHRFMTGDRTPASHTSFPLSKLPMVLDRVQSLNESRIQRDITPLIVPSAETLFFCDELNVDYIGDEVNADWTRCATMGGTVPKPDYTAGILPKAFTAEERENLQHYASPMRPFLFTPELAFPFLMCEAKTGERGMNEADRQNVHSASIAVRAIIELYKEAFGKTAPDRVRDLYGKILVFTVSHDNDRACVYGHFAVAATTPGEELEFYRHQFALTSLIVDDGRDSYRVYNFVRNVYDNFAPEHLERIKDAAKVLRRPGEPAATSFGTSALTLEEQDSQQSSQDALPAGDVIFQRPGIPASSPQNEVISNMRQQVENQRVQIDKLLQQSEEQREESKKQMDQMEKQMDQQREIISLLKQSKKAPG